LLLKSTNDIKLSTQDVTVRSNFIRGAAGGVNIAGVDAPMYRVAVENNVFADVDAPRWGDNGRLFQASNVEDLTITHNTGFVRGMLLSIEPPGCQRLTFTDNLVSHGAYGVKSSGVGVGTPSLLAVAPNYTFSGNIIVGGGGRDTYPPQNYFVQNAGEIGWADPTSPFPVLGTRSMYAHRATDGTNAGADGAVVEKATDGATGRRPAAR
jgi:hypothetical protein